VMHVKRNIIIGVIVVLLVGGAFFGGTVFARSGAIGDRAGFPGGAGGPMGNVSEADRAKIQNMTDAERQEFFQSQMGSQDGSSTAGPRGGGGGLVEGDVIEVATDTLTVKVGSNSQTIYTDSDTVIAYQDGAAKLAAGSKVLVVSERAADNVVTAQVVVVKK
jgi:hypothetical protein